MDLPASRGLRGSRRHIPVCLLGLQGGLLDLAGHAGRAFVLGGLLFGAYLTFTFLLAWTSFSPILNIIKAVLITLVAVSTLSSFLYSVYITFGRKFGLAINTASVALWQLLIPLGVMGMWTLMAQVRIWIVAGALVAALIWHWTDKRRAVKA